MSVLITSLYMQGEHSMQEYFLVFKSKKCGREIKGNGKFREKKL